jgi:HTH-type transcriptional regulator / antitoxin HigA
MRSTTKVVGRTILGFDRREYMRLVEQFPPVKTRTAEQAKATERRIEELLARPKLSEADEAYVDLLSDLLADWEDATVEIPDIHGVDLVRALLEDRGLRQKDLVGVFATESVASEVIAGRRELSRKHIEGLARYFKISPAAFFPADGDWSASGQAGIGHRVRVPPQVAPSRVGSRRPPSGETRPAKRRVKAPKRR